MGLMGYVPGTSAWHRRRDGKLCQQALDHIQEIVDRELPAGKIGHLDRHLAACQRCGAEAEVVRGLKEAIARVSGQADPASVAKLEAAARKLCQDQ